MRWRSFVVVVVRSPSDSLRSYYLRSSSTCSTSIYSVTTLPPVSTSSHRSFPPLNSFAREKARPRTSFATFPSCALPKVGLRPRNLSPAVAARAPFDRVCFQLITSLIVLIDAVMMILPSGVRSRTGGGRRSRGIARDSSRFSRGHHRAVPRAFARRGGPSRHEVFF